MPHTFIDLKKKNIEFNNSDPMQILDFCINQQFLNKISYVCSFGSESAIILHMISKIKKDLPIIFLNTYFLFEETIIYKQNLLSLLGLTNCIETFPKNSDLNVYDKYNNLWKSNPDLCCKIRKVLPLDNVLKPYKAWISGRKNYHDGKRKNLEIFDLVDNRVIVNPLKNFKLNNVLNYFSDNEIPHHPLTKKNYFSIGCTNCTVPTKDRDLIRSGRWNQSEKTECGIFYKKGQ